jgi:hypothetical protein
MYKAATQCLNRIYKLWLRVLEPEALVFDWGHDHDSPIEYSGAGL